MKRIVLSILVALAVAGCVPARLGGADDVAADDQPDDVAAPPDAGVATGIGTSPLWWPWWCLPHCPSGPGPTDTTGLAAVDAGP